MIEYYTDALVLEKEDFKESDGILTLYTEELGKVSLKAKGIKKILSKSSCHLEPLHFAKVRIIQNKNGSFQLVDAISFNKAKTLKMKTSPEILSKFLNISDFINEMTYELHPDENLWLLISKIFGSDIDEKNIRDYILQVMGFDPRHACCQLCQTKTNLEFNIKDHNYFCIDCLNQNSKLKMQNYHQKFKNFAISKDSFNSQSH